MTDYKKLCTELVEKINYTWGRGIPADVRELLERTRDALAEQESGIPKNCWLDAEPGLYLYPCVFDDPNEYVGNCTFATRLEADSKPKTDCKYYRQ